VGLFPAQLADQLRDRLSLGRAIETGTYKGDGTRALAAQFASVVSIEIDPRLAEGAQRALADVSNVRVVNGNSREELPLLIEPAVPTLYWLDGHWSGAATGGREEECPVLAELTATGSGHPNDCILIDDARLFLAPPGPPYDPRLWPTFMQLYDRARADRPGHHITVLHDIVIVVPQEAKAVVDAFASTRVSTGRIAFARRALRRVQSRALGR
jgi:hypothetical protein